jgi:hypothetical protein
MKAIKTLMIGTALAVASFGVAQAADPMVSEIDVSVEFSTADANALQFYPNLETDLEAKLAETLAPVMADDGGQIKVIVSDVSVDGSVILGGEGDFNTLSGGMFFYPVNPDKSEDASDVNPKTSTINVVAVPALPESMAADAPAYMVRPSEGAIYEAMINKFAAVVAERLPQL